MCIGINAQNLFILAKMLKTFCRTSSLRAPSELSELKIVNITILQVAQMQRPPQQPQLWHQPPPNVVEFLEADFFVNHTTVYPHYQIKEYSFGIISHFFLDALASLELVLSLTLSFLPSFLP